MTAATGRTPPARVSGARLVLGGEPVLAGVDVTAGAGEFLALLGANGSGKSTLLRVALGLQPLTDGSAELFGTPVARFRQWRRVAYVPQQLVNAGAVPVSVAETVSAGLIGLRPRLSARARRQRVQRALEHVGLWQRRREPLHTLSGGQQRRVLIAAALVKDAELLVLDEPTAGLDEANVAQLVALLTELHREGRTIVLVTHELGALAELVDHCVVLDSGRVRYDGPPPVPAALGDPHGHVEETTAPSVTPLWEAGP